MSEARDDDSATEEVTTRDALEAAFDAVEEKGNESNAPEPDVKPAESDTGGPSDVSTVSESDAATLEVSAEPKKEPAETSGAPVSWSPAAREVWDKVPPDVQKEISKREKEAQTVLNESAQARQIAEQFNGMTQPYQNLFSVRGNTSVQGVQEVLQLANGLQFGNKVQKAEIMAQLFKDFDIDVASVDDLLVGNPLSADEPAGMADMRARLDQQEQRFNQQQETVHNERVSTINTEVGDFITKNEFARDLRLDMADFMDVAESKGRKITLQVAYDRALATRPDIQTIIANRKNTESSGTVLEKARRAGTSLPQSGSVAGAPDVTKMSLRDQIKDAWDDQ